MSEPAPLLVSVREAARRLGAGRDTTYRLIHEGRLRTIRLNRRLLVPVVELERFVERESENGHGLGGGEACELVAFVERESGDRNGSTAEVPR